LATRIEQQLHGKVTLIPSSGGVFEVTVAGELVYSKRSSGVFPDEDTLLAKLRGKTS